MDRISYRTMASPGPAPRRFKPSVSRERSGSLQQYCVPFGPAALLMFSFVRIALGKPDAVSAVGAERVTSRPSASQYWFRETASFPVLASHRVERTWRGGVDQQLLSFGDNAPWAER